MYYSECGAVCCYVSLRGWRCLLCIIQRVALFVVMYHLEDGAVCYVLFRGWRCLLSCITQRVPQFVVMYYSEGGAVCCYVSLRGWRNSLQQMQVGYAVPAGC